MKDVKLIAENNIKEMYADINEIREISDYGFIDVVTTEPESISKEVLKGSTTEQVITDIIKAVNGIVNNSDRYDVSTEFDYLGFHYTVYLSIDTDGNVTKFSQVAKEKI